MTNYLSRYANFNTVEEMDTAAHQHVDIHGSSMNKTDRAGFEMIRCYTVKYLAVNLMHQNIETRRGLQQLEKHEIIYRFHYVRPVVRGRGANVYVILPVVDQGKVNDGTTVQEVDKDKFSPHIPISNLFSLTFKNLKI